MPADALAAVLSLLARLRATPEAPVTSGATATLAGEIAAACVHDLQLHLPGLTRGEGVLEIAFERYRPVTGTPPSRPHSGANPLNRKQYLLRVQRRVEAPLGPAK